MDIPFEERGSMDAWVARLAPTPVGVTLMSSFIVSSLSCRQFPRHWQEGGSRPTVASFILPVAERFERR
jgi:hypothetical protein